MAGNPFDKVGDLNYLIACGHHQLTSHEVAEILKHHLGTQTVTLGATLPGKLYTTANHSQVFLVQRVLPSGKQADVVFWTPEVSWAPERTLFATQRIFAGSYDRLFLLDELLTARLGVTQQMLVEQALRLELAVPVKVRIEHPQLFVTIPARFGKWEGARNKVIGGLLLTRDSLTASAIERVKNALSPDWFRGAGPCTVAKVQAWIEESHRTIQRMSCDRTRAAVSAPTLVQDFDKIIADQVNNIEFYRWLEPLVAPGGVFFNPEETPTDGSQPEPVPPPQDHPHPAPRRQGGLYSLRAGGGPRCLRCASPQGADAHPQAPSKGLTNNRTNRAPVRLRREAPDVRFV